MLTERKRRHNGTIVLELADKPQSVLELGNAINRDESGMRRDFCAEELVTLTMIQALPNMLRVSEPKLQSPART